MRIAPTTLFYFSVSLHMLSLKCPPRKPLPEFPSRIEHFVHCASIRSYVKACTMLYLKLYVYDCLPYQLVSSIKADIVSFAILICLANTELNGDPDSSFCLLMTLHWR